MDDEVMLSVVVAGAICLLLWFWRHSRHCWRITPSAAEYDSEKPIKLQGIVKKVEWINPHSWITIEVKRPNGSESNLGNRSRRAERHVPARLYEGFSAGRNRDRGRWLPREEREAESQWPGSHVPRRKEIVLGILKHRGSERRKRSRRKVVGLYKR